MRDTLTYQRAIDMRRLMQDPVDHPVPEQVDGHPYWFTLTARWAFAHFEEAWLKLAPLGAVPGEIDPMVLVIPFFERASIYIHVNARLPTSTGCSYTLRVPVVGAKTRSHEPHFLKHDYETWDDMLSDLVKVLDAENPDGHNKKG